MFISIILKKLAFIYSSNPKLSFHSRYQRRPLKHSPSERLQSPSNLRNIGHSRMQPSNTHVLFTRTLLRFHKPRGSINAHNQVPSYLRIKSTTMTGFINPKNPLNPSHNFMRRRISWFIKIENAIPDILSKRPFERQITRRQWSVMTSTYIKTVIVFQKNRPLRGVDRRSKTLRLDHKVSNFLGWLFVGTNSR
uniref:Uncharacterized protein n=1 Tax=Cucumis sativus TaxID=3659 RepID=A0A0A0LVL6_CUCSA